MLILVRQDKSHFSNKLIFLLKNNKASTCFGLRTLLNLVTVSPAFEKTLSEGTDVHGVKRNLLGRTVR